MLAESRIMTFRLSSASVACALFLLAAFIGAPLAKADQPDDLAKQLVARSRWGRWGLSQDAAHPGINCELSFIYEDIRKVEGLSFEGPTAKDTFLTFFGPRTDDAKSAIVYSSPLIPDTPKLKAIRAELLFDNAPPASAQALLAPHKDAVGSVVIPVPDMKAAITPMRDTQQLVGLRVDGVDVFTLRYDGGDAARQSMLDCLAGKVVETRQSARREVVVLPTGRASIHGQLYAKSSLVSSRVYPDKGHPVVLLMLTSELGQWLRQAKQPLSEDALPAEFKRLYRTAKTTDESGHFAFERLPVGEYLVMTRFHYGKRYMREETVGQRDLYQNGAYVGSQPVLDNVGRTKEQEAGIERRVVIQKADEAIQFEEEAK